MGLMMQFFFALPLITHNPRAGLALNGVWTTLSLTFLGWACWQLVTSGVEALWAMPFLSHAAVLFLAVHLSFRLPVGEGATRWDIRLVSLAVLAAFISASSLALLVCSMRDIRGWPSVDFALQCVLWISMMMCVTVRGPAKRLFPRKSSGAMQGGTSLDSPVLRSGGVP